MHTIRCTRIARALLAGCLLVALGGPTMAAPPKDPRLAEYMAINDRHFAELRRTPEVTGSSVGYSTDDPSRLVIKVHVRPGTSDAVKRGLPTQLEGAPVEVSEQGPSHRN